VKRTRRPTSPPPRTAQPLTGGQTAEKLADAATAASTKGNPSLGDLPELIESARRFDQTVEYATIGEPRPLTPITEMSIYRVIQESLTNCSRYAGAGAEVAVRLRYGSTDLEVEVSDSRPSRGSVTSGSTETRSEAEGRAKSEGLGLGIVGMRERHDRSRRQPRSRPEVTRRLARPCSHPLPAQHCLPGRLSYFWNCSPRGPQSPRQFSKGIPMTRVLLVDDQSMVRTGFRTILESEDGITVVGEAENGQIAIDKALELSPDVICMDVQMPVMDGLEATEEIVRRGAAGAVLMLTTFNRDDFLFRALDAGASGFLLKTAEAEQLIDAVTALAAGDGLLSPEVTRRVIERSVSTPEPAAPTAPELEHLTDRELEVLRLVATGASNSEIAGNLFVGEATVKTHVSNLLSKLGIRDRIHAVIWAYENGVAKVGG
jgi:DNA-binding NarL/FixJ family response regulator